MSPGRSGGAPVHVCCVSPCVFVVWDGIGGRALPCLQHYYNRGRWRREQVLLCACVVSITKLRKVNPIFAWEGLFALWVQWRRGPEVFLVYMCRVICFVDCMYVCLEGCVVRNGESESSSVE